jgi:hypothetical protein
MKKLVFYAEEIIDWLLLLVLVQKVILMTGFPLIVDVKIIAIKRNLFLIIKL